MNALTQAGIQVDAALANLDACIDAVIDCRDRNPNYPEPAVPVDINFEMRAIKTNVAVMKEMREELAFSMNVIQKKQKRGP